MNIEGYAFKSNGEELQTKYRDRLREIHHIYENGDIDFEMTPDYKRTHFSGTLHTDEAKALCDEDIFIIATNGRIPFGGFIERDNEHFWGDIYDD